MPDIEYNLLKRRLPSRNWSAKAGLPAPGPLSHGSRADRLAAASSLLHNDSHVPAAKGESSPPPPPKRASQFCRAPEGRIGLSPRATWASWAPTEEGGERRCHVAHQDEITAESAARPNRANLGRKGAGKSGTPSPGTPGKISRWGSEASSRASAGGTSPGGRGGGTCSGRPASDRSASGT